MKVQAKISNHLQLDRINAFEYLRVRVIHFCAKVFDGACVWELEVIIPNFLAVGVYQSVMLSHAETKSQSQSQGE
jgi:hypothetical protein